MALVVACAADKDHRGIMAQLRSLQPTVVVFTSTPVAGAARRWRRLRPRTSMIRPALPPPLPRLGSSARSASPGQLAGAWQLASVQGGPKFRCRELIAANITSAIDRAGRELSAQPGEGIVLVTGSLHAVSEALRAIGM